MKNILVLYHDGCRDGFGAAWAAYMHFKDQAVYRGIGFDATKEDIPFEWLDPRSKGRRVYMLDVFPENPELIREINRLHDLTVLDHHVTAKGQAHKFEDLDHRYSEDHSGAVMAWQHFHESETPLLLEYIEDRDLWNWELPNSEEINAWLRSHPMDFQTWVVITRALENQKSTAIREGQAILRHKDQQIEWLVQNAEKETIKRNGQELVSVSLNAKAYVSDVAHKLLEKHPDADVASVWHIENQEEGIIKVSLRSREDGPDVSKIAEDHGGGGHASAAGYRVKGHVMFGEKA